MEQNHPLSLKRLTQDAHYLTDVQIETLIIEGYE